MPTVSAVDRGHVRGRRDRVGLQRDTLGRAAAGTWTTQIRRLQRAGITPLIYIATDYGDRGGGPNFTLSTVESEVSQAVGWYGKNIGFMFDEGATACALESSYYLPLYNYVKSVTSSGPVEINAGRSTPRCRAT